MTNNGCWGPPETSGGGAEVAEGLMKSSPPSVIEMWRCCSLNTHFHTHFLLSCEHSKQSPSALSCFSNFNPTCTVSEEGNCRLMVPACTLPSPSVNLDGPQRTHAPASNTQTDI